MATIKNDTFTAANGTTLNNHTSDSGGGWQGQEAADVEINSNVAEGTGTAIHGTEGDENPSETHYFAEILDAQFGDMTEAQRVGVIVRSQMGASGRDNDSDGYWLDLSNQDGWRLRRTIAGSITEPGGFLDFDTGYISANSITTSTVIDMKLEVETIDASTVRCTASISLDGGAYSVVSTSDDTHASRITTAGNAGLLIDSGNHGGTTRAFIASFNAEDFTSASVDIPILVPTGPWR